MNGSPIQTAGATLLEYWESTAIITCSQYETCRPNTVNTKDPGQDKINDGQEITALYKLAVAMNYDELKRVVENRKQCRDIGQTTLKRTPVWLKFWLRWYDYSITYTHLYISAAT